jgi:DNA repair exonuclease SbcCD ATPase subunit
MATTHLTDLTLEGFKVFVNEASVEFPRSGLVLIRGTRTDGISSGTGKSSLLSGITYALKYCPESGTEVQSWLTDKPVRVKLGLEQSGGEVALTRGAKSSLGIGNAKPITGAAAIDQHLEKLIGLPPELLAALTYREQGSGGVFLSKDDSDKKSFLSVVLGLTSIEEEVEKAQDRIKGLEKELAALEVRRDAKVVQAQTEMAKAPSVDMVDIEALEQALATIVAERAQTDRFYQKAKLELAGAIEVGRQNVAELTLKYNSVAKALTDELADFEKTRPVFVGDTTQRDATMKTLAEVETRLLQRKVALEGTRAEIRAQLDPLKIEIFKRRQDGEKLPKLHDKIAKLNKEREDAYCSQCKQKWVKSDIEYNSFGDEIALIDAEIDLISNRALEVEMLQSDVKKLEERLAESDPLIAQLEKIKTDLNAKLADISADMKVAEAAFYADFNQKITVKRADISAAKAEGMKRVAEYQATHKIAEEGYRASAEALARDLNGVNLRVSEMQGRINTGRATNNMKLDAIRAHDDNVKAVQAAVDALRSVVTAKVAEITAERDFVKLTGREGFLGNIFSEVLLEIAAETNKILKNVPNVAHCTIKFKNETTTGKGSVKKVITPMVSVAGMERPLGPSLSGGMRCAVDLAVDLAVRRVICRRSGHNPAWLILDEPFEGLSAVEKECILQILKGYAQECLILVVDHATETKESFTKVIEVSNHNGRSSIN